MTVELNKNELHILKHLAWYKAASISSMVFGVLGVPFGVYARLFLSQCCAYLNNALIAASVAVAAMGYMILSFVLLIGVFKREWERQEQRGR
jgi:hypothetical protein